MTALSRLTEHLHSLRFGGADHAIADAARLRVFDIVVAAGIGAHLDDAVPLRALHAATVGTGAARLEDQVRLHVALIRSTETDDVEPRSCVTAGAVVVPVALLAGAAWRCDEMEILTAIAAGYEAMIGLGRAIDGAFQLGRDIWPTYVVAPFGAAVVASRLLRLAAPQMEAALSLALARTAVLAGRASTGASPRFHLLGCAAAEGLGAARAAAAGFGGDASLLAGLALHLGLSPLPDVMEEGRDAILQVDCKPYPTARQCLSAIEAFRSIWSDDSAAKVVRIEVEVPSVHRDMVGRFGVPPARIPSLTSAACQIGLAAHGDALNDARRNSPVSAELVGFMERIEIGTAPDLDAAFPRQWGSRVRVHLRGGEVRTAHIMDPQGSAALPFGWREIRAKGERIFNASGIDASILPELERLSAALAWGESAGTRLVGLTFR